MTETLWGPSARELVVKDAAPEAVRTAVARDWLPSLKTTLPVGVPPPPPLAVTRAVMVTGCPCKSPLEGEVETATALGDLPTVAEVAAELLVKNELDPA